MTIYQDGPPEKQNGAETRPYRTVLRSRSVFPGLWRGLLGCGHVIFILTHREPKVAMCPYCRRQARNDEH